MFEHEPIPKRVATTGRDHSISLATPNQLTRILAQLRNHDGVRSHINNLLDRAFGL